ncbi:MAG: hypothetical protein OXB88_06110 [Bacteriovoracales bacterium]|nr:hypothetical protein [Bacteriovoracales bacterium]
MMNRLKLVKLTLALSLMSMGIVTQAQANEDQGLGERKTHCALGQIMEGSRSKRALEEEGKGQERKKASVLSN